MRVSAGRIANALAWATLIGLIGVAFAMVTILGPFGLAVLGLFTLFVCTSLDLHDDVPTRSTGVFRARIASVASPEQRAALLEEKRTRLSPLRFYRWSGLVLLLAGAAGFAWQHL